MGIRRAASGVVAVVAAGVMGCTVPTPGAPTSTTVPSSGPRTERVSLADDGSEGNDWSAGGAISADGRFVAFVSAASNLVPGVADLPQQVYVRDRVAGRTELVSVSSSGEPGDSLSFSVSISADGRFVAFDSAATNLVADDSNETADVFVHDRRTGSTERVSVSSEDGEADASSREPAISADGRFVAFESAASNLVPGTNNSRQVFLRDREAGVTELLSVTSQGEPASGDSGGAAISADGRFVAFGSAASNLVPGATSGHGDVFVRDRQTGVTELVSTAAGGAASDGPSHSPSLSADGRFVVFRSLAANLVAGDTNEWFDVFVRDRQSSVTTRVSVHTSGAQGVRVDSMLWFPESGTSISADGRFVAFESVMSGLVADDTNEEVDVFVHDRLTAATERVSVAAGGDQAGGEYPTVSSDGRFVVFASWLPNLVPDDTNSAGDVFLRDRGD